MVTLHKGSPALVAPDGLPTLYGVFRSYNDQCATRFQSSGWSDQTAAQYDSTMRNHIIPSLPNHDTKSIIDYTKDDLDAAIETIRAKGKRDDPSDYEPYEENTLAGFQRLLETIFYVAAQNNLCADVYQDDTVVSEVKQRFYNQNIIPKSLAPRQEYDAAIQLMKTCLEKGESVGLLLMFALGLRPAEACGATFGNIHAATSNGAAFHYLSVIHTTSINSSKLKLGGKSVNAVRFIPVPDSLYAILMHIRDVRVASLCKQNRQPAPDSLPLVCKGNHFEHACQTADLSRAGSDFFLTIGMRSEDLSAIKLALLQDESAAKELSAEEAFSSQEKDVTTYIFRRNFATHLEILGLTKSEREYVMGHKMEDILLHRSLYSNTDLLYEIKKKMDRRPIFNCIDDTSSYYVKENSNIRASHPLPAKFIFPAGASITVTLSSADPAVPIRSSVHTMSGKPVKAQITTYTAPAPETYSKELSILNIYHQTYQKVLNGYVLCLE